MESPSPKNAENDANKITGDPCNVTARPTVFKPCSGWKSMRSSKTRKRRDAPPGMRFMIFDLHIAGQNQHTFWERTAKGICLQL